MSSTVVKSGFEDSLVSWRSSTDGGLAVPGVRPSILPKPDFFSRRPESSKLLRELTECGTALPSLEKVLDNKYFPFIESCSQAHSSSWGVLKISNIPFDVNRAEVIALIGKNSRILNDVHEPVHIIMERTSSKTEDVFVEFMTSEDASKCIERLIKNSEKGRPPRLGNRVVTLKISDQTELMKALFPHAKGVDWLGSVPQIKEVGPDGWDHERFRGFMTMDEMAMLVKHAEVPTRAPFSHNVPQRPFECLISTIKKLPWYRSENITVAQRYQIYDATEKLVTMLKEKIDLAKQEVHANLNEQLFKRLVKAAMICPGFSALQKDNIAHIAGLTQPECATFNQPFFAYEWRHLHTICPRPNKMPMDLLDWYIAFIRQQSSEQIADRPEKEQAEIYLKARHTTDYFGYLWVEINLPEGPALDQMSLKDLYLREVGAIHRGFTRVLKRSTNPEALPESEEKEQ
ncbi:hypothetical protein QBC38DRAFT_427468 [Podospora fimiseda]|uniref:RRM domain-containing protein n=1 Tax=Podospora fimiseda TaxID=252190 RepID=A0AAN7BFQ7_9PEZI|nr:hypothetical protein QBC38DRAFT_427468 [Podospora fimiseda]